MRKLMNRRIYLSLFFAVSLVFLNGPVRAACNLPDGTFVDITLKSIEFKNDNAVCNDGGTAYSGTDWEQNKKQPVSYKSGEKLSVVAKWDLSKSGLDVSNWRVRATGPDNIKIGFTGGGKSVSCSGSVLTMSEESDDQQVSFTAGTVKYYPSFSLTWEISFDGGSTWSRDGDEDCPAGASENLLYVTCDEPSGTMYHTALHLACYNNDGATDESVIVAAIWAEFSNRSVKKVNPQDGSFQTSDLKYWGPNAQGNVTTAQLLDAGDGQCGAWMAFFHDVLALHKISSSEIAVVNETGHGDAFLVKNATFSEPPNHIPEIWAYDWPSQITLGQGVPGQGNSNPRKAFYDHALVEYGGEYYDPSYGGSPFSSLHDFEEASLIGYINTQLSRIKKNSSSETEVKVQ